MAHIADIIKYEGDNSTFIWKHPLEDFNSLTQLIVYDDQFTSYEAQIDYYTNYIKGGMTGSL